MFIKEWSDSSVLVHAIDPDNEGFKAGTLFNGVDGFSKGLSADIRLPKVEEEGQSDSVVFIM
ncbi:hypothetical protein FPOAC1_009993 [Fusarium poae]|uniref:hypothetical protein n=1 Tax=Fusarium poae TaxID=36050 RepID=UPI001CE76378|nr:hypothetical protein FPOAC1_009993 [Fusarium poae]KAG8670569.1 hypothetical protein FPOAC1_009993 [Fusarium poae]